MTITVYPVKFEAYDDTTKDLVFVVEAVDEAAASVTIKGCIDVAAWDGLAPKIRAALAALRLGELS